MQLNAMLHTDGTGYWSQRVADVRVTRLDVPYIADDLNFGELRIYFDTATWDVKQDGLIYTDKRFMRNLRFMFTGLGFDLSEACLDYSEQGMQGGDFVSCDVNGEFISQWLMINSAREKELA